MACNGLKKGPFHLFRHPKWSKTTFEKTHCLPIFDQFLAHFFVEKQPNFKALCDSGEAQMACNGLTMHFNC